MVARASREGASRLVGAGRLSEVARTPSRALPRDEPKDAVGGEHHDDDDQCGGGDDPSGTSPVQVDERGATTRVPFSEQEPGDDEARDDVEDIDADVAAVQPWESRMVEDDQEESDSSQSLNVGPEPAEFRSGTSFVPRHEVLGARGGGHRQHRRLYTCRIGRTGALTLYSSRIVALRACELHNAHHVVATTTNRTLSHDSASATTTAPSRENALGKLRLERDLDRFLDPCQPELQPSRARLRALHFGDDAPPRRSQPRIHGRGRTLVAAGP
jgi:hypothetical protein